jgi:hypothetical protein
MELVYNRVFYLIGLNLTVIYLLSYFSLAIIIELQSYLTSIFVIKLDFIFLLTCNFHISHLLMNKCSLNI